MPGSVHASSLGRWFEELCRINVVRLRKVVASSGTKLAPAALPDEGGVYAFWWTGGRALLNSCNPTIALVGPGGSQVTLEMDDEWLGLQTGLPIPLYVGKSAQSIRKRVGQHLMLGSAKILPGAKGHRKAKAPTTACQLRAGIEHLFPEERDSRPLLLQNVGLSYVRLDGPENAANRFYLEDMAIGLMRPPLNIDVER